MSNPFFVPKSQLEITHDAARAMLAALKKSYAAWSNNLERHGMDGDDAWTDQDHIEWQDAAPEMRAAIAQAEAAGITTGEDLPK